MRNDNQVLREYAWQKRMPKKWRRSKFDESGNKIYDVAKRKWSEWTHPKPSYDPKQTNHARMLLRKSIRTMKRDTPKAADAIKMLGEQAKKAVKPARAFEEAVKGND